MEQIPRVGDLDIEQDLDFERRQWHVQRVGWVVFLLILLAAFVGLLGTGRSAMSSRRPDRSPWSTTGSPGNAPQRSFSSRWNPAPPPMAS